MELLEAQGFENTPLIALFLVVSITYSTITVLLNFIEDQRQVKLKLNALLASWGVIT